MGIAHAHQESEDARDPVTRPPQGAAAMLKLATGAGNQAMARMLARDVIGGNPSDLKNDKVQGSTVHAMPTGNNTVGSDNGYTPAHIDERQIKIKATKDNPVLVTGSADFPGDEKLFDTVTTGGTAVNEIEQTKPDYTITDSLFIKGQPTAADVQQGGIGDCWDLATVAAIAARDPGKITSMVVGGGNGIVASFFRKKTHVELGLPPKLTKTWDPVTVAVNGELAFNADKDGKRICSVDPNGQIHGSQIRRSDTPIDRKWWAEIDGKKVKRCSAVTCEAARWAPLMEKAYGRFAEEYGQYGGSGKDGEKSGNGYASIHGGFSADLFGVFYGEAGDQDAHPENVQVINTEVTPGQPAVLNNAGLIGKLVPLQGLPDQSDAKTPGDVPLVTASTSSASMIKRLGPFLDYLLGFPETEKELSIWTMSRLKELKKTVSDRLAGKEGVKDSDLPIACAALVNPSYGRDLLNARSHQKIGLAARDVVDLALDLAHLGTDHGGGAQLNVFPEHVYTVMSSHFADATGKPIVLPALPAEPDKLKETLAPVDQEQSTVRVRNPHHAGEPDDVGSGAPTRPENGPRDDGLFNMTLTQFIINFSRIDTMTAKHS